MLQIFWIERKYNNDNNRCLKLIERNDNWTSAAYISWVGRCLTTCILLTELGNCMKDIASRWKEPTSSEHGESSQINNAINKVSIQYIETLGALCVYVSIRMFYSPVGLCMIWILYACTFVPMNILALRRALFAIWRAAGSIESEIQKRVSVLPQNHCCISRYRRTYQQKNKTKHSQWEKGWSSRTVIHTRDSLCLDFNLDRFCVCVCVVFHRWIKQTVLWVCVCVCHISAEKWLAQTNIENCVVQEINAPCGCIVYPFLLFHNKTVEAIDSLHMHRMRMCDELIVQCVWWCIFIISIEQLCVDGVNETRKKNTQPD